MRIRSRRRAFHPLIDGLEERSLLSVQGVLTYHNDISRTGMTTGFVGDPVAGPWGLYAQVTVDPSSSTPTPVRGAPLVLTDYAVPGSSTPHNLIIAASSANYVAAYEEDQLRAGNTAPLWRIQLGPPMLNGEAPYLHGGVIGDWSTGVIDPSTGLLYLMADISSDGSGNFGTAQYHVFQINPGTGAVLANVTLAGQMTNGPTFNPNNEDQRGALNLVNGWIYATFATYPNETVNTDYHGWVVGVSAANLSNQVYYSDTSSSSWVTTPANPNGYFLGAGIWGPGGVAADSTGGTLYTGTGNAPFADAAADANPNDPTMATYYAQLGGKHPGDIGDHFNDVVALSGDGSLTLKGWVAPDLGSNDSIYGTTDYQRYSNSQDWDLGGASPLVLPDGILGYNLEVVAGKEGDVFLLNRSSTAVAGNSLGGFGGQLWDWIDDSGQNPGHSPLFPAGADYPPGAGSKGSPAYYHDASTGTDWVYLVGDEPSGSTQPGLVAFQVVASSTGTPMLKRMWSGPNLGGNAASPVVTVTPGGSALVWTGSTDGTLYAFDARTGQQVYSASTVSGLPHFAAITADPASTDTSNPAYNRSSVLVGTLTGFDAFGSLDTTAPTTTASVSGSAGNAGWYTGAVTVTLTATDPDNAASLTTTYSVDGGAPQAYTAPFAISADGTHTVTYQSADPEGNVEATRSLTVMIDATPPTTTASTAASGTSVIVTLTATDNAGGSGVAATSYSVDGGAAQTYAGPFAVTASAAHTITYHSVDVAGNVEATATLATLKGDTTAPKTTASVAGPAGNKGWYTGAVTVTLTATDPDDPAASLTTTYSVDGGAAQAYAGPFAISADGTHTVTYYSTDPGGNVEKTRSLAVKVDQTPPTTTASAAGTAGSNGWYTEAVKVKFAATDNAGGSGVAATQYSLDGGTNWTTGKSVALNKDGLYTVSYRSSDVAGNVEATHTLAIKIDRTKPHITAAATVVPVDQHTAAVTVLGTMTDNLSGIDPNQATYTILDGPSNVMASGNIVVNPDGSFSFTVNLARTKNNHKYTMRIMDKDQAGNLVTITMNVTVPGIS